MAKRTVEESSLTMVADAIREGTGTSDPLVFPEGFVAGVDCMSKAVMYTEQTLTEEQKAQARENMGVTLENLGAVGVEKLWENARPTSSFAAQSITVNLSGYDFYAVVARYHTTMAHELTWQARVGSPMLMVCGDNSSSARRRAEYSSNSLAFTELSRWDFLANIGSAVTNNDYLIPIAIYGIKGVPK